MLLVGLLYSWKIPKYNKLANQPPPLLCAICTPNQGKWCAPRTGWPMHTPAACTRPTGMHMVHLTATSRHPTRAAYRGSKENPPRGALRVDNPALPGDAQHPLSHARLAPAARWLPRANPRRAALPTARGGDIHPNSTRNVIRLAC